MTDQKYNAELEKIQKRNKQIEMRRNLKAAKVSRLPKFKIPSTSKLVLLIVFIISIQIIIFGEFMAVRTCDTSYMYALIGVPAALIPTILGYYHKSRCENTIGGITYDMALSQMDHEDNIENEAVG